MVIRQQRTVRDAVTFGGYGYWSGHDVEVTLRPAPPGTGITFVRTDLPNTPRIPVAAAHRIDVARRTNLQVGEASVEMVEHVLAALAGLRVDNCIIESNAAEMPGGDGSSFAVVEAISRAGTVEQALPRERLVVDRIVRVGADDSWVEAAPNHDGRFYAEYELDYGRHSSIRAGVFGGNIHPSFFIRELAPARTFVLQSEADLLRKQGLGQRVTPHDLLVFDEQGVVDNQLRYPDECIRHKVLDMVGDLALAGCDLVGSFRAYRSGHQLNAELVVRLLELAGTEPNQRHSARQRTA